MSSGGCGAGRDRGSWPTEQATAQVAAKVLQGSPYGVQNGRIAISEGCSVDKGRAVDS